MAIKEMSYGGRGDGETCHHSTNYPWSLLSKKRSKKELTKRPPFLVKSLVWKSSEKTVNGGWRDGRTLEPF